MARKLFTAALGRSLFRAVPFVSVFLYGLLFTTPRVTLRMLLPL